MILLLCGVSSGVYAQSTSRPPLPVIANSLAQGLEAKKLLEKAYQDLHNRDSVININNEIIRDLRTQVALVQENYSVSKLKEDKLDEQLKECALAGDEKDKTIRRLKNGRNFWRGLAAAEGIYIIIREGIAALL